MAVEIRETTFDPAAELRRYQERLVPASYGATVTFVGTMRDFNDGSAVECMTLEHYPGMTEKSLRILCDEAGTRWPILDAFIVHRVGAILPNEPIVLVAVWSEHRAAAFDACRYLIDELKTRAPFWKKEQLPGATRWVEKNTPG